MGPIRTSLARRDRTMPVGYVAKDRLSLRLLLLLLTLTSGEATPGKTLSYSLGMTSAPSELIYNLFQ